MKTFVFCLFVLFACVFAQENEVKFVIDPFTAQTDTIVILIPTGGLSEYDTPITQEAFVSANNIMGEERDVLLTVTSGDGNLVLSTGVSGGQYTASTPNEARGNSLYQLDGIDGTTILDPAGLNNHPNNDFTNGDAFAIRVLMEADLPGRVFFRFYSGVANAICQHFQELPGDDTLHEYIIRYDQFDTTNCDFRNIGAIEIVIAMDDNVDIIIQDFSTWGPVQTCRCECPAFTCRLYFDLDDDYFSYYRTSQFGVFNPTTDLSTLYTTNTVVQPSASPFPSLSTDFTTIFSTSFSFSTFSTFTSFSTFTFSDDDSDSTTGNSPSSPSDSSSDASSVSVTIALIAMLVISLF